MSQSQLSYIKNQPRRILCVIIIATVSIALTMFLSNSMIDHKILLTKLTDIFSPNLNRTVKRYDNFLCNTAGNSTNITLYSIKGDSEIIPQMYWGLNNQKTFFVGLLGFIYFGKGPNIVVLPKVFDSYPNLLITNNNRYGTSVNRSNIDISRMFVDFEDVYNLSLIQQTLKPFNLTFVKYQQIQKCNFTIILESGLAFYMAQYSRYQGTPLGKLALNSIKPHQHVLNEVDALIQSMTEENSYFFALQARIENDMKHQLGHDLPNITQIFMMIQNSFSEELLKGSKYLFIAVGTDITDEEREVLERGITPWNASIVMSNEIAIKNKYSYNVNAMFDFEVCLRAKLFIGWDRSTFSGMVAKQKNYIFTFDYLWPKGWITNETHIKKWNGRGKYAYFNASDIKL